MSEATQTLSSQIPAVSNDDSAFLGITQKEVLRIIKGYNHSLVGTMIQPFQNAVSGWLGVEFGPTTADWSKTVKARQAYHTGIMDQLHSVHAANDPRFEVLKTGTRG